MLLSKKTTVIVNKNESEIISLMCIAAYKLWNICDYERRNYKELNLDKFPDWFYQKSAHKDDYWYKMLPSQTAQDVCKVFDKSWKSYEKLCETGGIKNPRPPRFKKEGMFINYMQNGIVHVQGDDSVRLTLSKKLQEYISENKKIDAKYLFLKNKIFQDIEKIKQIRLYPPKKERRKYIVEVIVVYEIPDVPMVPDNEHYLSVDLGLHNLMTCFDSAGKTFIIGREYLSMSRYFDKEIARVQSEWMEIQSRKGIKYPKSSKHINRLYRKKLNSINDYLHKVTNYLVQYCKDNDISILIIGDITNIRKDTDLGGKINQQFHALPYRKIYEKLEYKLKKNGITMVLQNESYTSQCPPDSPEVSKKYAEGKNRIHRGLYIKDKIIYNADAVGAFNIMRKYIAATGKNIKLSLSGTKSVNVIKVAV